MKVITPERTSFSFATDFTPAPASVRQWAQTLGVPLAYLYADNADLAEVILAFGLLPEPEQRRLAVELKARVSLPATRTRPARKARATPRTR